MNFIDSSRSRIKEWQNRRRIVQLARQVAAHSQARGDVQPVAFFNATARLGGLSQNAAFAMLTSHGLRLNGVPVAHFVCKAGMSRCVLGTNRQNHQKPPPCQTCILQSQRIYDSARAHWFEYAHNEELNAAIRDLDVEELNAFEFGIATSQQANAIPIPLGELVLPSLRWALRRHSLPDDEQTRYLLRQYILSAYSVAQEFDLFLERTKPQSAVIFNGTMYPEAVARWVATQRSLRVITHEVGFQPFSAFYTEGQSTAYPIQIPPEYELTPQQNERLDSYLEKRFQGKFTMAGIRFWPEMHGLDEEFLQKVDQFRQVVPVFTNVVYDTSQVHANCAFPHMFAWLDTILELIRAHPDTLFVIRAHPDEMRPGTAKQSQESVRGWVKTNNVLALPNVIFIDSQEYISSYELIQRAKFIFVYNSSIGLEAALMGSPVLCGGKARYTQYPIVFLPDSSHAYRAAAERFLQAEEIEIPQEFRRNARQFLYYQLYRTSLSFADFLDEGGRKGYVHLRSFPWSALAPENSITIRTLVDGILDGSKPDSFLLPENP